MDNNSDPRCSASSKYLAAILDCTWADSQKMDGNMGDSTLNDDFRSRSDKSSLFSVLNQSKTVFKPSMFSVYIFTPKSRSKPLKLVSDSSCHLISVLVIPRAVQRQKFIKFIKLCTPVDMQDPSLMRTKVEEIGWLSIIQLVISTANAVVYLMVNCQSTVILSLESSGSDFTTQVSSLAQIMMDPFYRTFEGFKVLVEKDWISFGHRFSTPTGNQSTDLLAALSPVFLIFLDCVHQVLEQCPLSFQYNDVFLRFMAYHHVSNRFVNFLNLSDLAGSKIQGNDIWKFINSVNEHSLVFSNLYYSSATEDILRPFCEIYNLTLWDFYTEMIFSSVPVYEFVVRSDTANNSTVMHLESPREGDEPISIWNSSHFDMLHNTGALYQKIFEEANTSLVESLKKCTVGLDTLKCVNHGEADSISSAYHRFVSNCFLGGDSVANSSSALSSKNIAHNFMPFSSLTPLRCAYCHHFSMNQNVLRCNKCHCNVHFKCLNLLTSTCGSAIKPMEGYNPDSSTMNSEQFSYETPDTFMNDDKVDSRISIAFSSHLSKKGFANRWQKRFFCYDSANHHMLYYIDAVGTVAKGCIDLSSVMAVNTLPGQGSCADDLTFELKTLHRSYIFMASTSDEARRWIDIISGYIR